MFHCPGSLVSVMSPVGFDISAQSERCLGRVSLRDVSTLCPVRGSRCQSGIGRCVDLEDLVEAPCANFSITELLLCSLSILQLLSLNSNICKEAIEGFVDRAVVCVFDVALLTSGLLNRTCILVRGGCSTFPSFFCT